MRCPFYKKMAANLYATEEESKIRSEIKITSGNILPSISKKKKIKALVV